MDNGASNWQRTFIYGATVAWVPLPGGLLLLGSGLLGLAGWRVGRKRK